MVQFPHGVYLYIYIAIPKKMPKKQIFTVGIDFSFFWNHPMDIGDSDAWRVLAEATMFFFPGNN